MEDCLPWEDPILDQAENKEDGVAETMCGEQAVTPPSCPPVLLWGRR